MTNAAAVTAGFNGLNIGSGVAHPPPTGLTPVQQGDVSAGRARLVDGQIFTVPPAGTPSQSPPIDRWSSEPVSSPYRQTYDRVAARLGTTDPAAVEAEIERLLYAPANATVSAAGALGGQAESVNATPNAVSATTTPSKPEGSAEGFRSFIEGAVTGDFGKNDSWSATAGQVATGFIPFIGQVADARDTIAAIGQVARGEDGGWLSLGASIVGWVPGGDVVKGMIRGGDKVVEGGEAIAETVARQGDDVAAAATRQADEVVPRKQIVMDGGEPGAWPKELNARNLEPNADYLVNGYKYATDAQGRVTQVSGKLDLQVAERNGYQQRVSGREDRLETDQGGHLIASIFNGPGDRLNLVPMNGNFNMGRWKSMETSFADALTAGKQVDLKIDVVYGAEGQRPVGFMVTSVVDGAVAVRTFRNVPGGG